MPRRKTFTVDAEDIQGIEGAEVTFRALKVREFKAYRETDMTDTELMEQHILSWSGFVDDNDKPLPSPDDDPDVIGELYLHERQELSRLLFQGPDGTNAKN